MILFLLSVVGLIYKFTAELIHRLIHVLSSVILRYHFLEMVLINTMTCCESLVTMNIHDLLDIIIPIFKISYLYGSHGPFSAIDIRSFDYLGSFSLEILGY